jgi:gluconolactonase
MMGLRVHSERILELIDEQPAIEQIATGLGFTEGPIWNPDGYLLFSDLFDDVRRRWDERAGLAAVAAPSHKGNGMTLDADHRLIVCEHATSCLARMSPDGGGTDRTVLASHYEGASLNSPNDVVVDSRGRIYFSDPTYGRMRGVGIERARELSFQGVYRIDPDGAGPYLLVDDFAQPNGLCFSPDEATLFVSDTERGDIRAFDVGDDGLLRNGRAFGVNVGAGADGMKCDELGNLWATGPGGIWIFSPEGEHWGLVELEEPVANIHWGGPDWTWLFITATSSVFRMPTKVCGRRESFMC